MLLHLLAKIPVIVVKEIFVTATVITLAQIYTILAAMTQVAAVVTVVDMAAVIAIVVVLTAVAVVMVEDFKFRYASAHYPPDNLATKLSLLGQLHPYYYPWGAILLVVFEDNHQFG